MDKPADHSLASDVRVLHVDDEPMICDVTRLCLEKGGRFRVDAVHSAEEALALLRSSTYACVISDYEMPSMNGIELLREIRSFDPEIPFILFSGRGRETVIIDAINTGADFYIQKGGDAKSLFAELNHKVDYAINKRNARLSLKRRDAILEAVSLVATLFLGGESFQKAISESVTLFGLATEVDRVMVYRLSEELDVPSEFRCLCSWVRPGVFPGDEEDNETIPCAYSFTEKILDGEIVIGTSGIFDDVPAGFLIHQQIRSVAAFPVIAEQKIRGMVMFCDCVYEREWALVEVDALQAAAAIIGSAIYQDEMRTELIDGKQRYESMYSLMRQLCDAVPDMLWAKDLEGKYIFVNRETATGLLGVPDTNDPVGKKESDFHISERNSASFQDEITSQSSPYLVPASGYHRTESTERIVTRNGEDIELEIRSVPFFNGTGELIGSVAVGRDVTSARNAERMVHTERMRYSHIFHRVHIGLISCSMDGIITDLNQRAEELLCFEESKGKGLNLHSLRGLRNNNLIRDFSIAVVQKKTVRGKGEFTDIKGNSRILYYAIAPECNERAGIHDLILTIDEHYED